MDTIVSCLNSVGGLFVDFALGMLIQSSVLIVILLGLDFVLRKKVRAVFRYCVWMLVLVKLVLPTSLAAPSGIMYWLNVELPEVTHEESVVAGQPEIIFSLIEPMDQIPPKKAMTPSPVDILSIEPESIQSVTTAVPVTPADSITWQGIVFLVWVSVVITLMLLLLQRLIFVRGLIAQSQDAGGKMADSFVQCCRQMGIRRKISIKLSSNAASPSVCGLFRPTILIPVELPDKLAAGHLQAVLLHELAHIKRGDLWVSFVQAILQIVYFYNPLLWLANSIIRQTREQAVDEMVQVAMGEKAENYPETLVNVFRVSFSRPALGLRLIGVVESKSSLRNRVKHMINRPIPKTAKLGFVGLAAVILFAAILLPMAKAKSDVALEKGPLKNENIVPEANSKIPEEYIGHWKGQARIIVNWTKQKKLPIEIEIQADGAVEGTFGDAQLVNGRLIKKSWVYTEVFQHENPYRIEGDLQGEIIKSESIQRDSVTMSIRVEDGKIDGGLGTSGTKIGSKENMKLSAMDVSLIKIDVPVEVEGVGSKLEFRVAPEYADMTETVLKDYLADLAANGPVASRKRKDDFAWFEILEGTILNNPYLITSKYQGSKYLLLHNKDPYIMLRDDGWGLQKVEAATDHIGLAVGFDLDVKGAELLGTLTASNIHKELAIVIDNKVYSAPTIMSKVRDEAKIVRKFSEAQVSDLVKALKVGMPPIELRSNEYPGFEPVVHAVVLGGVLSSKDCLIDFDKGLILSRLELEDIVNKSHKENFQWIQQAGVDGSGATQKSVRGLIGYDILCHPVPESFWETMTADNMMGKGHWQDYQPGTVVYMPAQGELPATYMFKTREGGIGILQITGFSEKPQGVKIRYRMVNR